MDKPVDIAERMALITEHWRPRTAAEFSGQELRIVKTEGTFPWHFHENYDEVFIGWKGVVKVEFRDRIVSSGDVRNKSCEPQHLGAQDAVGDPTLVLMDQLGPESVDVGRRSLEPAFERVEDGLACRVDEDAIDVAEGVVAGGAPCGPARRELLVALEDLFDEDVCSTGRRLQSVEVTARVCEAVRVVDPKPVDKSFADPPDDLRV